ncbi:hypothetical protein AB0C96_01045 [Streptomyces sp. NPDC048506]|uniref:hypothetical protein n=1 Tax=Streptomyces sp. NPDC048506 TaxID=3155028 RepID=UPI0034472B33
MSGERKATPAPGSGLRLLPWESDSGKPCYLSADGSWSRMSRIADEIEAEQLCDGADVVEGAQAVLDDGRAGEHALRLALRAATQALVAVLRVAHSRGARLPDPDGEGVSRTLVERQPPASGPDQSG